MFKIPVHFPGPFRPETPAFPGWLLAALALVLLVNGGCNTMAPMAPVDVSAPGWRVREGQAVWRKNRDAPELAGELLVATSDTGRTLVQFAKNPFPLIVAQQTPRSWEIQLPTQNRRYSGPGKPPARIIWLYLPGLIEGASPPKNWTWQGLGDHRWRLENTKTGQMLEGFLSP